MELKTIDWSKRLRCCTIKIHTRIKTYRRVLDVLLFSVGEHIVVHQSSYYNLQKTLVMMIFLPLLLIK